jgi:energy-coupling factor transporter ATP-binding protein EcfA2
LTDSTKIKLKSLNFGAQPFRKLRNLKIDFADRLTIIAGHNGIGKTTILGLIANNFGLTSSSDPKSYFNESFSSNIERIVYLDLDEVALAQLHPDEAPVVEIAIGEELLSKRCAMTKRTEHKRARVVPRTIGGAEVGQDAKVQLPSIYLGLRRLAPIGEAGENDVISRKFSIDPLDGQLMVDFVNEVIIGSGVDDNITYQSIVGSKKKTLQPGYKIHKALAVSMGQDSLGSIATALASFNRLKRELGDEYPGGLLVIDELDVGFHPHAIERLTKELKSQARRLHLQIVATTHSPRLIEAVHPDGDGNGQSPDAVIYLLDTKNPRRAEDQSLKAVLDDMALRTEVIPIKKKQKPKLCIYFEDPEGMQFCEALIPSAMRSKLARKNGVLFKLIPLGVGGSNLIQLADHDPIFKDRILIPDADTTVGKKYVTRGNVSKLPCPKGATKTDRSPENVIKNFLREMASGKNEQFNQAMLQLSVKNASSDKLLSTFFSDASSNERNSSKNWWQDHWETLAEWGVIREWANCHKKEVAAFIKNFEDAVAVTAQRLK